MRILKLKYWVSSDTFTNLFVFNNSVFRNNISPKSCLIINYKIKVDIEVQLVEKGIITEAEANRIFGRPVDGTVSRKFRHTLYWLRNRRRLVGEALY